MEYNANKHKNDGAFFAISTSTIKVGDVHLIKTYGLKAISLFWTEEYGQLAIFPAHDLKRFKSWANARGIKY